MQDASRPDREEDSSSDSPSRPIDPLDALAAERLEFLTCDPFGSEASAEAEADERLPGAQ